MIRPTLIDLNPIQFNYYYIGKTYCVIVNVNSIVQHVIQIKKWNKKSVNVRVKSIP